MNRWTLSRSTISRSARSSGRHARLPLVCVLLMGGAGLASRSVFLIHAADLGFAKDHRLILRLNTLGSAAGRDAMLE